MNVRFGQTFAEGGHGGTGIALYKHWLYAEVNDRIERYDLKEGETAPAGPAETILSGMPITGDHPMHPFAIDAEGNLFVSMGSATNACEVRNRMPHSPGNDPCTELETRAGIWKYDANKAGQVFSAKERYVSGIRNGEGFDFDTSGRLFVTQHGRDQLHEDWPELYTTEQGFELPAEEVMIVKDGAFALVVVMLVLVATVAIPVVVPMAMMVPVVMPTIMIPMSMPALDTMHYAAGDALAGIPLLCQGRCASRQHDSGGGGK